MTKAYNEFPAHITTRLAKELLDGKTSPKEIYPLYAHLEKIEINTTSLYRYLIVISTYFQYDLMSMELIVDTGKRYIRCQEVVSSLLFKSEDLRHRLKRDLMHKMLDAFIDGESEQP